MRRRWIASIACSGVAAALGISWWRRGLRHVEPPPPPPRSAWSPGKRATGLPWDLFGILGTGQSLAVGVDGLPFLEGSHAAGHFQLGLGDATLYDADDPELSLVPLREPLRELGRRYPGPYPFNIRGETPHTAMAIQIGALCQAQLGRSCSTVHSVVGESGQGMRVIERDARPTREVSHAWVASLFEARAIHRLARAAGKSYGVGAIVLTHGESDAERPEYADELRRFWRDYNADLTGITGQAQSIPLFLTQQCSAPAQPGGVSAATLAAWQVARDSAGDIVCVGPRYQYAYADDHIHLVAKSYARLGEKYGQVIFQHVMQGRAFRPLEPISLERRGAALAVKFHVPVAPLRWDEALRGSNEARGFQLLHAGVPLTLASVELEGSDSVLIVPHDLPAEPLVLRYALAATTPGPSGTRRFGQLCDSDPFVGAHTHTAQPNYAVCFELPVPAAG